MRMATVNPDGKLLPRIIGVVIGSIPAVIGIIITGVMWSAKMEANDRTTAETITRIERRVDGVEKDMRDARDAAAADRQKLAELNSAVQSMAKTTDRIDRRLETLFDRLMSQPVAPRQP